MVKLGSLGNFPVICHDSATLAWVPSRYQSQFGCGYILEGTKSIMGAGLGGAEKLIMAKLQCVYTHLMKLMYGILETFSTLPVQEVNVDCLKLYVFSCQAVGEAPKGVGPGI